MLCIIIIFVIIIMRACQIAVVSHSSEDQVLSLGLWVPMGSVLALSTRPGRQNSPFPQDRPLSRWDRRDGRLPNPGSFDGLHRNCKGLCWICMLFYKFH